MGLVHLYFGDGKGKTTAAAGLALRACGHGMKVLFVQFLKDNSSGEVFAIENLLTNVTFLKHEPVKKFVFTMSQAEREETKEKQRGLFFDALRELWHGEFDLVVFDELLDAVSLEMISLEEITSFLGGRGDKLEVVFTGHAPHTDFFSYCDYITEMKKIKHPYDSGQKARTGIEM